VNFSSRRSSFQCSSIQFIPKSKNLSSQTFVVQHRIDTDHMTTISTPTAFSSALIAGGLAGTAVDTLFFPIDTLKTRAQSHAGFFPSGGFSGVYRGLGSAVVGSAPGGKNFL
jgi:hypothetical protein